MKNKSNFKNELEMTFALQQMEKTAPEIVRFQGLWSEMGDSNSRHLAPKASALPTALIPDMKFRLIRRPDVLIQECVCKWLRHRT